ARVTSTDALGGATPTLFTEFGRPGQVIDPLGRTTQFKYDGNQNLILASGSGGSTYSYAYDSRGNLVRQIDSLGHETALSYDPQLNRLGTISKIGTVQYQ